MAAAVYGLALGAIAFWPTHVDQGVSVFDTAPGRWLLARGLTYEPTYDALEVSSNVAMFVPLGVLAMMVSRRMTWPRAVLVALVVSGAIELVQAIARPGRTADPQDVIANAAGAALGAGIVLLVRRARR
ncbi:VanZ family protein [Aeromicrobium sp.]|uniref:VanZ family protein n=1 Tax=Aeromicrobium sp. TaxID=1871063 RepID=UPI0030C2DDF5